MQRLDTFRWTRSERAPFRPPDGDRIKWRIDIHIVPSALALAIITMLRARPRAIR
jgi:hypothetical protein